MKKNFHSNRFQAVAAEGAVDWDHPLNATNLGRRVAWYYAPPGIPASGTIIKNLCDSRTNGTLTSFSATANPWLATPRGDVGLFDGSGAATVSVPLNLLSGATGATMACWVRTTNISFNSPAFLDTEHSTGNGYMLNTDGNSVPKFQFNKRVAFTTATVTSDVSWVVNVWTHLIGTMKSDGTLNLWVNGAKQSGSTAGDPTVLTDVQTTLLAVCGTSRDLYISDMSVWSRALNDTEAPALYEMSLQGYQVPDSPLKIYSTRTWSVPSGPPPSFNPGWAYGATSGVIGTGVF